MAALEKLREEATCSVCLEYFKDPVSIDCGHNFCRACINRCWGTSEGSFPCPQCRQAIPERSFRANKSLGNMAELVENISLEAPKAPPGEKGVCTRHQEPLKLFCRDDETPICVICRESRDHRSHAVLPIEEAAQDYKTPSLQGLMQEEEGIQADPASSSSEEQQEEKPQEEKPRGKSRMGTTSSTWKAADLSAEMAGMLGMQQQVLEKLNYSNYALWSYKMEMYLLLAGLWDVITKDSPGEEDEGYDAWEKLDGRARAAISLAVEDSQISFIQFLKTAKECWEALKGVYQRDTAGSKVILARKLYRLSLQPGGSLPNHLKAIWDLFNQLRARGLVFTPISQVYIILSSLDASYETIIAILMEQDEATLTVEYVTGKLLQEWEKREAVKEASDNSRKSAAGGSKESQLEITNARGFTNVSSLKAKKCFICGSTTHLKRDCKKKKKKQQQLRQEGSVPEGAFRIAKSLIARVVSGTAEL